MKQKLIHILLALFLGGAILPHSAGQSFAQSGADRQDLPTRDQGYLRDLVSLSETIGSAHAVRVRCNGADDQYWRAYMVQILGLEAPFQGSLRARMVAGFNRGFENENRSQRLCDASSNEREAQYAIQGRLLSESLAAYYFPRREQE